MNMIQQDERYTLMECDSGTVIVINPTKDKPAMLQLEDNDEGITYIALTNEDIDLLIEALQNAKNSPAGTALH